MAVNFLALILVVGLLWAIYRVLQGRGALFTTVYPWDHALAYVDGRFHRILPPGRYLTLGLRRRDIFTIRSTDQVLTTPLVDVTSSDKFVFRLSATVTYRVTEPRQAFENAYRDKLNQQVATALVRLAAERTLEAVLSDRVGLDAAFRALLRSPIAGCEILEGTIQGVALPPEVRRLFTEIERAKLESSAALERARGEQAALRSLANAARMLKGNPELMNLRVLQALAMPGASRPTLILGQNGLLPPTPESEAQPGS
ncbi:MAG TPA: SPFH domain-containing protein [Microvirga sp.]|nr:SPFH domain-containing protein [Microvirga sp.]